MNNSNYYVVHGWMINELGLKGQELILYAIIHGFSQADGTWFTGNLTYLAEWAGSTKQRVCASLKSLCEKGFLEKAEENSGGVKVIKYRANGVTKMVTGCYQNGNGGVTKMVTGCYQNGNGGVTKMVTGCYQNGNGGVTKMVTPTSNIKYIDNKANNIADNITPIVPFEDFWQAYPRHDAKAQAKKIWDKLSPDKDLWRYIKHSIQQFAADGKWDDPKYIPMPSTFLNQQRWTDYDPPAKPRKICYEIDRSAPLQDRLDDKAGFRAWYEDEEDG